MKRITLILFLFSIPLSAWTQEAPLFNKNRQLNGRGWISLKEAGKAGYVFGFADGLSVGVINAGEYVKNNLESELDLRQIRKLIDDNNPHEFSRAEVISEIDRFYEETANILIPVYQAHEWVNLKMRGASPSYLQARLGIMRRLASMDESAP